MMRRHENVGRSRSPDAKRQKTDDNTVAAPDIPRMSSDTVAVESFQVFREQVVEEVRARQVSTSNGRARQINT